MLTGTSVPADTNVSRSALAIIDEAHARNEETTADAVVPMVNGYGTRGRSEWLDIDWRQYLRSAQVQGSRVNYVEMGAGLPVVLMHGFSSSWQHWLENIPHLANRHRIIALDLPGFGESELPRERITIPGYARFLDAFFDEIDVEHAALVGNSMGGFIAAQAAISHPERVAKLVLVAATGISALKKGTYVTRLTVLTQRVARPIAGFTAARRAKLVRRPGLRRALLWAALRYPERLGAELTYELLSGVHKPGGATALNAMCEYDLQHSIARIRCPTLVVWGANDLVMPLRDCHHCERLIPGARKVVFADTRHGPMIERPERFNRLVERFLAE